MKLAEWTARGVKKGRKCAIEQEIRVSTHIFKSCKPFGNGRFRELKTVSKVFKEIVVQNSER
jgi:hypothetical protein